MKFFCFLLAAALLALPATAAPMLSAGTTVFGGRVVGSNFVAGTVGVSANTNNWSATQSPTRLVNGIMGGDSEKYLNSAITNTAVIFTSPVARPVSRTELWVANDSVKRDPASYQLYGTNAAIPSLTGGNTVALTSFTLLGSGNLSLPDARDTTADATGLSQILVIPNTTAYASYLLVFPTVKGPSPDAMQLSEVQLYDSGVIGVEQFDYPDGSIDTKNGGTFWNYNNIAPTGQSGAASDWDNVAAEPAVASGRLVTQDSSAKREYNGPGEGFPPSDEGDGAVNEGNVSHSVYYRVTVTTGATVPDFFGLSSYDFGNEKIFWGKRFGESKFGMDESGVDGSNSTTTPDILPNTTYLLVAKLDYATDTIALWVNPGLNAPETGQTPAVTRTYTGTNWSTAVRLASGSGSPVTWDDLVVATSWDDLGTVVDTVTDEDNGNLLGSVSLREAVKYSPAGSLITFLPGLSGQTITLTHADGDMEIPGACTIDASALPGGITVGGNNASRHFFVGSGKSLTLRGLTLTGGNGGGINSGRGGAILNNGGNVTMTHCTLSGNTSSSGGAISNAATLTLMHCTLSGNSTSLDGGAINNEFSTVTLTHCTLSGNTASRDGGAIFNTIGTVTLNNSIVAGNATGSGIGADIQNLDSVTRVGANLVQSLHNDPGGSVTGSGTISTADPKLSPLGYFGGPVQTMHPLIGSPAIDAAGTTDPGGTDVRGFPRFVDGNGDLTDQLDIGAVEVGRGAFFPVTTLADEDDGDLFDSFGAGTSLRESINYSAAGSIIVFSPALAGQTITLTQGQLSIPANANLFIDASNLTAPVTISGNPTTPSRVFNIPATATVAMHSLKIVGGKAGGGDGGGILNSGTCTLLASTLSGNLASTSLGGGIRNTGICLVISSTLSGNSAFTGGGIRNDGTCTVLSSTLSGNSTIDDGGGIFNSGTCSVLSSTLSGNSAAAFGGGIFNDGTFSLASSIVAGNIGGIGPNISGLLNNGGPNNLTTGDPLLAPLGDYGGPTWTMPPLPGSPALDAGVTTTAQTDQRGFPRSRDGDGNGTALPDIGSVEAGHIAVTNPNNEGPGSLRQAVLDAAALPGPDVIFFTAAVTGPITLTTQILITDTTGGVTIDASNRPAGQTISGGNAIRHFEVPAGNSLTLRGLTLTGGNGVGGSQTVGGSIISDGILNLHLSTLTGNASTSAGGAIFSTGTLRATDCTLSENTTSGFGGAIMLFSGTVEITRCTFSGNTAATGGTIWHQGATAATLSHCTVVGSRSTGSFSVGGVAAAGGTLNLQHCTLSQNTGNGAGGGLYLQSPATVNVHSCIIAGNADLLSNRADIHFQNDGPTLNATGTNLIGSNESVATQFPPVANLVGTAAAPVNPRLSPLGSYGGPTQTMPPLAGSPAIDAAGATSTFTTDQRGRTRVVDGNNSGTAQTDIGAVESAIRFVTNDNDSGSGSLRQALTDAAAAPGWEAIAFVPSLNAGTIPLTTPDPLSASTGIVITDTDGVAIDASSLPGGLTITKPTGDWRLFRVNSGKRLSLHQLTLTGGSVTSDFGGAIHSDGGTLSLSDCTLTGNTAQDGGAIFSNSDVISTGRFTEVRRCTLTGNTALTGKGGAIRNSIGKTTVLFSTISGNTAPGTSGGGIASSGNTATLTEVTSSIVSANPGGDVVFTDQSTNSFLSRGHNLIGTGNGNTNFTQTGDINNNTNPLLVPLSRIGGPTPTMALLRGSPARNAGPPNGRLIDQRGFPLLGMPDIGAFEAQINNIADVTTAEDTAVTTASFSVGLTGPLTVAANNTELIPNANIIMNGSGTTRTVTMTPAANQSGTTIIEVFDISTGEFLDFTLTVTPVNDAPTISNITDRTIIEDANTGAVAFTLGDVETAAASLTVSATSSNTTLVPNANITFSGSGANRTVTVMPAANLSGSATITVTVNDGTTTASDTFLLTVTAVNDAPTISNITDRTILEDANTGAVAFTLGDVETSAASLTLAAVSSNLTLVPNANITFGGSGASRTVTVTPAANQSGSATITVTVNDGTTTASDTFLLTITAVNDAPSFTKGTDLSVVNTAGVQTVTNWATALSAGPADESAQTLSFTVTNANNALFTAQPALAANGTLTFTPAPAATGSAVVTVRLNDTGGTANGGVNQSAAQIFNITLTGAPALMVTSTADSGPGSLRQILADAASRPGADTVTFAAGLGPIILASEIIITDPASVTLDASDRPAGIHIDGGPDLNRHFRVDTGTTAVFQRLKLTGGNGVGTGTPLNYGGSIHNSGTLTLRECTVADNSSTNAAGAIYNQAGALTVERCTFHNNTSGGVGAILHESLTPMTITASTFTNNRARFEGGALTVSNFRPATLTHCTITGNHVTQTGSSGGGGIRTTAGAGNLLTLRDCIVTGNTDANSPGVPNVADGFTSQGNNITSGDTLLAPLADYGGPTLTIALRPGSPARNTATTSTLTSDQRGFPIVGVRDIGAYEAGTPGNPATTLAETLPNTIPANSITPEADYDGDGQSNGAELIAGTLPTDPTSVFRPEAYLDNGDLLIIFPTLSGRTYTLQRSDDLAAGNWVNTELTVTGNGTTHGFRLPFTPGAPRRFYRIVVTRP